MALQFLLCANTSASGVKMTVGCIALWLRYKIRTHQRQVGAILC